MDAVTYPNAEVAEFVSKNVIPLRLRFDAEPLAKDYSVKWTPTLILLDASGKEHSRTVGFLPPDELIPSLLLGIGKVYFDQDQFSLSIPFLDKVIFDYPKSGPAAEAVFLRGVSGFKSTHDPKLLRKIYDRLQTDYPASEWAKRAVPYQAL
jgi:hypothetical protein